MIILTRLLAVKEATAVPFVRSKMLSDAKSSTVLRSQLRLLLTSIVLGLLRGHDLPVNSPAGVVACFDGVEEILNTKVGVHTGQ